MDTTNDAKILLGYRYELVQSLGQGGMGEVYLAHDRLTNQHVALKRVSVPAELLSFMSRPSSADLDSVQLALANEFKLLASLRHPHIISVIDYSFDAERQPYYVMELLRDAQSFLVAAAGYSLSEKIGYIIQVLQALAYLHRRGIIHRDLKPDNVQVVNGQVKVLDFGLAVMQSTLARDDGPGSGTLMYMSPEVLDGHHATFASDLYAVGVMAYELLAERHPFPLRGVGVNAWLDGVLNRPADLTALPGGEAVRAAVGKLLEKQPTDRYKSATDAIIALCAAFAIPQPPETAAIRESFVQAADFVGREVEFGTLLKALSSTLRSQGSLWLVGGESGVGKSRFIDELRTQALVFGAHVLVGQGTTEGGQPYQLWREPLRRMVLATQPDDVSASILKEIVPTIGTLLGRDIPDAPSLDAARDRQRLVLTIIDTLKALREPTVLLLEDLQWVTESLQPLHEVGDLIANLPLLIIGTYRDDERPGLPTEFPQAHLIKLERLVADEVARLSASMLGQAGQEPGLVTFLHRETEGNVFFITEVVRALAEEVGQLDLIGAMTIPSRVFAKGMANILQRRLDRVPLSARPLLRLAAVAGRQLDLALLRATPLADNLEQWLTLGNDSAVLEVKDDQWRFAHDKLREALLDQISDQDKAGLHRLVAQGIERVYPGDDSRTVLLFEHWLAAGDVAKLSHYADLATSQLLRLGNYQETLTTAQRALRMIETDESHKTSRVILEGRVASAYLGQGEFEASAKAFERQIAAAERAEDKASVVTALEGMAHAKKSQGDYALALEYANQAESVGRACGDKGALARALARLGDISHEQGDKETALAKLAEALTLFQTLGDQPGMAATMYRIGVSFNEAKQQVQAREQVTEALRIYTEINDRPGILRCLNTLSNIMSDMGQAFQLRQQALLLAREMGDRDNICIILSNLGNGHFTVGDYPQAIALFSESLALAEALKSPMRVATITVNLALAHQDKGDVAISIAPAQRAADMLRSMKLLYVLPYSLVASALGHAMLGNLSEALPYAEEAIAVGEKLDSSHLIGRACVDMGKVHMTVGNWDQARLYLERGLSAGQAGQDDEIILEASAYLSFIASLSNDVSTAAAQLSVGLVASKQIEIVPLHAQLLASAAWLLLGKQQALEARRLAHLLLAHPTTSYFVRRYCITPLLDRLGESEVGLSTHPSSESLAPNLRLELDNLLM